PRLRTAPRNTAPYRLIVLCSSCFHAMPSDCHFYEFAFIGTHVNASVGIEFCLPRVLELRFLSRQNGGHECRAYEEIGEHVSQHGCTSQHELGFRSIWQFTTHRLDAQRVNHSVLQIEAGAANYLQIGASSPDLSANRTSRFAVRSTSPATGGARLSVRARF